MEKLRSTDHRALTTAPASWTAVLPRRFTEFPSRNAVVPVAPSRNLG
jgi:hypothetical protein